MTSDAVKYNGATALTSEYTYDNNGNITSKLYSMGQEDSGRTIDMINEYDSKNRITAIGYNEYFMYYEYDSDGQLIRVDNEYTDNSTSIYSYDSRGNITQKKSYFFTRNEDINTALTETKTFTYANAGWKDQLIEVNGVALTYDEIGNVLTYGNRSFTWNNGRNLAQITDNGNTYSYKYDENGIRTSKTVNGVTTYYNTKNGVILSQSNGTDTMYFQYDNKGVPLGFVLNGTQYFYITNQMGDVVAITESNGDIIGEYVYDEWGYILSENTMDPDTDPEPVKAVEMNPLRYRGYCYDRETGYYYLQSRYYDPSICRFINADIPEIAQMSKDISAGTNIFAYCNNDPVNNMDDNGQFSSTLIRNFFTNMKTFIQRKINYIIKQKLGIYKRGNYLHIRRETLATAINIVVTIGGAISSAIKSTAVKATCRTIYNYAKNNSKKFADFITRKYIDVIANAFVKITEVSFAAFARSVGLRIAISFTKDTIKSAILKNFPVLEWINSLRSPGGIIAFILDAITDYNIKNHEIIIKVR